MLFAVRLCDMDHQILLAYWGFEEYIPVSEKLLGVRHFQYMLMFAAVILAYGMRTILNVAIVAIISEKKSEYYPTYPEWKGEKNLMLSSFFWGYLCLQIGAGQLAKKYGPKLFLGFAIFIASLFTILVPLFGKQFGYGGVIVCRVIQGICQGFLLPSMSNLLSAWTHISERAKWGGRVYSGQPFGNVVAMPITGLLCASKYGWPLVFYVYGGLGVAWCGIWMIFGSDNPSKHKSISETEREWLKNENLDENNDKEFPTPWKSIFTSLPFLAIIMAHSGENWGYWTLLTEIPSYMNDILHFEIGSNSILSALPYLAMWLLTMVTGTVADMLIDKNIFSLEVSRKVFNSIGFFVPAIALAILGVLNSTDKVIVIIILTVAVAFNSGQYSGFMINHIDLSPNFAGTLMAITNSIATVFSIIAPLAVDFVSSISGYKETENQLWALIFYIAAAVHIITGVAFDVFGSGKVQKWNTPDNEEAKPVDEVNKKVLRKISVSMAV